jgi:hypothetical protein
VLRVDAVLRHLRTRAAVGSDAMTAATVPGR